MNLDFLNHFNKKEDANLNDFASDLNAFLENTLSTFKNGDSFTIDRFEQSSVVLENRSSGRMHTISMDKIPNNAKEGDILTFLNGELLLDADKTKSVSDRIQSKFDRLKKK